jgi:hypothetical protein
MFHGFSKFLFRQRNETPTPQLHSKSIQAGKIAKFGGKTYCTYSMALQRLHILYTFMLQKLLLEWQIFTSTIPQ